MIKILKPAESIKYFCAYGIFALLFAFLLQNVFALTYFLCVVPVFFIEPFLTENSTDKSKLYFVFLLITAFFSSTYDYVYDVSSTQLNKFLCCVGATLFLAGLIAVTDKKNFNYCILILPILLFVEKRLCICLSALFLSIFILNLFYESKTKQKKSKKKKEPAISLLNIVYVLVSLLGLIASIILYVTTSTKPFEVFSNFLYFGLNCFTAVLVMAYILIKLIRNDSAFIRPIAIGLLILIGTSVFCAVYVGLVALAVSILSTLFYLVYCCLQSASTIDSIRTDYDRYQLGFWIGAMLLLI